MSLMKSLSVSVPAIAVVLSIFSCVVSGTALSSETSWLSQSVGISFYGLARTNSDTLVAVGERGTVVKLTVDRTPPSGVRFALTTVGQSGLTGLCAWRDGTLAMTGQDGTIWRSNDGDSWTRAMIVRSREGAVDEAQASEPLFNCWCGDDGVGIAVGAFGKILRTVNYGRDWSTASVQDDDDYHLYDVFQNRGDLIIIGEAGRIYRSGDNGQSWLREVSPYNGSLFSGLSIINGSVLAFGLRGTVLERSPEDGDWRVVRAAGQIEPYFAAVEAGQDVLLGSATGDIDGRHEEKIENVIKIPGRPSVMGIAKFNGGYLLATTHGLSIIKP